MPWTDPAAVPFIRFDNVTKRFGDFVAVKDLTLDIYEKEFFSLLGPSGCGKTTLMRMLAGFEEPTTGRILLQGKDISGVPPYRRPTNMMFQSYALFPHLTVRDNIAFALRVRGLNKTDRYAKTDAMIEKVRLTEFADRLPAQLSGGQQQRVALARAAITEPRVLLLDEPLSALDEHLRLRMRTELRRMQQDLGITFIHVTHTQLEAIALADMVVVMDKGRIRQAGPAREIYAEPRDRYVAEFIGGQNVLSGRVNFINGSRATMAGTMFSEISIPLTSGRKLEMGQALDIAVRRDDIELMKPAGRPVIPDHSTSVEGKILGVEYQGNFVKVMLEAAGEEEFVAYLPERRFFEDDFSVGDPVIAVWPIDRTQLLA